MAKLWRIRTKYQTWLDMELAVLKARAIHGEISMKVYQQIKKYARFSVKRILDLDEVFDQETNAFVVCVQESLARKGLSKIAGEFHGKLTSNDKIDTTHMILLGQAADLILVEYRALARHLHDLAKKHKWTLQMADTHGQPAKPSTFGHIVLDFTALIERRVDAIELARDKYLKVGKVSGAVGNFIGINPKVEETALGILGLSPTKVSVQIIERDRHAEFMNALALAATSVERIAITFWVLMHGLIDELSEARKPGKRDSSSMPHKKNPSHTERLWGLPRVVRACASIAQENIANVGYRTLNHSGPERLIFPIGTSYAHFIGREAKELVQGLEVHVDKMKLHLDQALDVWVSQDVRNALIDQGVSVDDAYLYTQHACFKALEQKPPLLNVLKKLPLSKTDKRTALNIIGADLLTSFFDPKARIEQGIEHIFRTEA